MITGHREAGLWWIRIFGAGISWKNIRTHPLLFSERIGRRQGLRLGTWQFHWLSREDLKIGEKMTKHWITNCKFFTEEDTTAEFKDQVDCPTCRDILTGREKAGLVENLIDSRVNYKYCVQCTTKVSLNATQCLVCNHREFITQEEVDKKRAKAQAAVSEAAERFSLWKVLGCVFVATVLCYPICLIVQVYLFVQKGQ